MFKVNYVFPQKGTNIAQDLINPELIPVKEDVLNIGGEFFRVDCRIITYGALGQITGAALRLYPCQNPGISDRFPAKKSSKF